MPADIITMEDCASNYGVFEIPSSDGKQTYTVTMSGSAALSRSHLIPTIKA